MSGIKPKRNTSGRFSFIFNVLAHILAVKYASDR